MHSARMTETLMINLHASSLSVCLISHVRRSFGRLPLRRARNLIASKTFISDIFENERLLWVIVEHPSPM